MYICICNNITDTKIVESVNNGSTCLDDVKNDLGVATKCGKCRCQCEEIINKTLPKALFYGV